MDESGQLHPNDSALKHVLCAVCIPKESMKYVLQVMYNIRLDIFGKSDVELKASKYLTKRSVLGKTKNKSFVDRTVSDVINRAEGLRIFGIVMDRPENEPEIGELLPNQYRFLLQRINAYARRKRTLAVLAFDEIDEEKDTTVANRIKNYLFRSNEGHGTSNIVESAFFVSSQVEDGIQLADLIAGIIRHKYEIDAGVETHPLFRSWISELYGKVSANTVNLQDRDKMLHAIYTMNSTTPITPIIP